MEKQSLLEMSQDLARQSPPLLECDIAFAPAIAQGQVWGMRWTPKQTKRPGKRARSGLTLHEGIFRAELLALGATVRHLGPPSFRKLDGEGLARQYLSWRQGFLAGREKVRGEAPTNAEKQQDERRRIIWTAIQRFCIPWRAALLSNKWIRFLPPSSKKPGAQLWEKMVPHAAKMPGLAVRWYRSMEKDVSDGLDPADAIPAALYVENPAWRKGKDGKAEIFWSKIIGDSINKFMRDGEKAPLGLDGLLEAADPNAEGALLALLALDDADLLEKRLRKIEEWDARGKGKGKAYKAERLYRTARRKGDVRRANGRPALARQHGTTQKAMICAGKQWEYFLMDLRRVS